MVVDSKFVVVHSNYLLEDAFNNSRIEREILYDWNDGTFVDVQLYDEPCKIENIYRELHPIHIELIRARHEDMIVKDVRGRLTLLSVIPF